MKPLCLTIIADTPDSLVYRLLRIVNDNIATIEKVSDNYYEEYLKRVEEYVPERETGEILW